MVYLAQIILALVASGFLLTFVSERFGHNISRIVEAAFDSVEYQLAQRAERRVVKKQVERVPSSAHARLSF